MKRDNNIVFPAIFLFLFAVCGGASAHPFYVGVAEVRMDTQKSTLTVSCRLFTDDLENALTRLYARPFDLQESADDPAVKNFVGRYITQRFGIGIAGTVQRLSFVGMEKEDEATWCYLESSNFTGAGSVTVTNSLLYDFLPDQVNIIHVYLDGRRQSARLVNPDKSAGFRF